MSRNWTKLRTKEPTNASLPAEHETAGQWSWSPASWATTVTMIVRARRRWRARRERSSPPPRRRPRSHRSCPSTGPARSGQRPRQPLRELAEGDERRPGIRGIERPGARRSSARGRRGAAARAARPIARSASAGRKPALAGSTSTLTWSRTGYGGPGRISGTSRSRRAREVERVDRLDRLEDAPAPGGPCSTGAGRPGATSRRGRAATLASALLDPVLAEQVEPGCDRVAQRRPAGPSSRPRPGSPRRGRVRRACTPSAIRSRTPARAAR